jgi:hypothetical protein
MSKSLQYPTRCYYGEVDLSVCAPERGTIPGRLHRSRTRKRNELQRVVVRPLS